MGNKKSKVTKAESSNQSHKLIKDRFTSYSDLQQALRNIGLESSNLIIGIDFTKSNTWNGGMPYYPNENLHSLAPVPNPYQQVITIIGKTLEVFDDDKLIPTYGFGDASSKDHSVFSFMTDQMSGQEAPCYTFSNVLAVYNTIINNFALGKMQMSGPTSFAALINKAIDIVSKLKTYHILLIVCDGAVDCVKETTEAIVRASSHPLSIISIGIGKADFKIMEDFDDNIPERQFDNFQFVDFYKVMQQCENEEAEFAKHALMEIPEQYAYIKKYILNK